MKTLFIAMTAIFALGACDDAGDETAAAPEATAEATAVPEATAAPEATSPAATDAPPKRLRRPRRGRRRAAFAERIEKFDSNGDGSLDATERTAMRADRIARMFSRLDSDSSGAISKDEATAARRARRMLKDFDAIDTDGSGDISQTELETRMSERAKHRQGRRSKRGAAE